MMFLALLAALGGGVRMVRAAGEPDPGVDAQIALRRQIISVDSARAARKEAAGKRPTRAPRAPSGEPRTRTASGRASAPRVSAARVSVGAGVRGANSARSGGVEDAPLVDVDAASAEELTTLPGIGPAIAARIVEDRQRHGQYGSLRELQRVKGVGPATVARLAPHVTFSGTPRPPSAVRGGWPGVSGRARP